MRNFFSFGGVLLGSTLLAQPQHAAAQPTPAAIRADTLPAHRWYVPHHLVGQFAGGQGMMTAGLGYSLSRRRLDLDLLAGYVPCRYSITPMTILTAKVTYMPWTIALGRRGWAVRPLAVGGYLSYTASEGLNETQDGKYPAGYYWWSANTRVGGFLGGRIAHPLPSRCPAKPRRLVSFYYELGTNELYVTNWWGNPRGLTLLDVATLGVGIKLDI
jgi:hypothetical protein